MYLHQELDSFMSSQEEEGRCKREMLYKKWNERVFQPIQAKLGSKVNSEVRSNLRRRRQVFDSYLTYQNTKVDRGGLSCESVNLFSLPPSLRLCSWTPSAVRSTTHFSNPTALR